MKNIYYEKKISKGQDTKDLKKHGNHYKNDSLIKYLYN